MLNGLEEGWEEKSRNGVQQDKMEVLSRLEGTRRWVEVIRRGRMERR